MVVRGALSAPPVRLSLLRPVFRGTTSALVYRYFLGKGDVARAEPLVPAYRQGRQSEFVSDELKAIRMLALSTGGNGMTHKARIEYYDSVAAAEVATAVAAKRVLMELEQQMALPSSGSSKSSTRSSSSDSDWAGGNSAGSDASSASRPRLAKKTSLRKRLRRAIRDAKAKVVKGPLTSAFPTAASFASSLKGEQDRCLAEMKWQVTDIVEGDVYKFYFRDVMDVAEEAFGRATNVQLRGKRQLNDDGCIKRSNSLDSDVYLDQEADVLDVHANAIHDGKPIKPFAMAVQFFSDASLISWNGGTFGSGYALFVSGSVTVWSFCCATVDAVPLTHSWALTRIFIFLLGALYVSLIFLPQPTMCTRCACAFPTS